jgi:pimeloyl-ACP methyl ester carboxylesterase
MVLDPHEAQIPHAMVAGFVQWMTHHFAGHAEGAHIAPGTAADGPVTVSPGVREQAVFLDESRTLFGIASLPAGERPKHAVLLLNSGANHHIGTGRMYVKFARRLAERGRLVLRYDVSGIGDSAPQAGERDNVVYTSRAVGDLATALGFVRDRLGAEQVEVAGLCSGAYFGFKGAVAGLPIDGVTVVNPLVFFWKDGMSLAYPPFQMVQAAAQYQRSMLRPEKWLKLVRGKVDLRTVAQVVTHRAAERTQRLARNILRVLGIRPAEDLAGELEQVVGRGTTLRFVFSVGDPGEALLDDGAGWTLARLERRRAISLTHLPDCDHSLSSAWMHELLWRELSRALSTT